MTKILKIERKYPRSDGVIEAPLLTPSGYKMADPKNGPERHHSKHSIFVSNLDDVADGIRRGHSLWMKDIAGNRRETLILAKNLIVRS